MWVCFQRVMTRACLVTRLTTHYFVAHNRLVRGRALHIKSVRQVIGVSQETLRHWRSALPSLAGLKGHAPIFRPGHLLGLAIVRALVEEFGLTVGALKTVERDIFELSSSPEWVRLARGYLLIHPAAGSARLVDRIADEHVGCASIVLPLDRIVFSLRDALLEVAPGEAQQSIAFPPVGMPISRATSRGDRS